MTSLVDQYGKELRSEVNHEESKRRQALGYLSASYDAFQRRGLDDHFLYAQAAAAESTDTAQVRLELISMSRYEFRNNALLQ